MIILRLCHHITVSLMSHNLGLCHEHACCFCQYFKNHLATMCIDADQISLVIIFIKNHLLVQPSKYLVHVYVWVTVLSSYNTYIHILQLSTVLKTNGRLLFVLNIDLNIQHVDQHVMNFKNCDHGLHALFQHYHQKSCLLTVDQPCMGFILFSCIYCCVQCFQ